MMGLSWIQNRYSRFDTKTSEEFNTASRSVKPGLIAAGIVSAWTWAATLLQSATVGYRYGVAGETTPITLSHTGLLTLNGQGPSGTLQERPYKSSCSRSWLARLK
jgi:Na+/proline symporter